MVVPRAGTAQGIVVADVDDPGTDRGPAGVHIAATEEKGARAVFRQRTRAKADGSGKVRVTRAADGQVLIGAVDGCGKCEGAGIRIDAAGGREIYDARPGIVAADVPQRPTVGDTGAAQSQGLGADTDAALNFKRGAAADLGAARRSAKRVTIGNIEHACVDRSGALINIAASERQPAGTGFDQGAVLDDSVDRHVGG